jgi:flagellar hook-associated protein 1 FlgK
MGLSVALESALSGLRLSETGLETVSRNIANVGVDGYAKRTLAGVERQGVGVRDGEVRRVLDSIVQRQLRTETAGGAYASTMATVLSRLDEAFGAPGGAGALDTVYSAFASGLQALANEPGSMIARRAMVEAGRGLAASLNGLSQDIQEARADAEARISSLVGEANVALQSIEKVSARLNASINGNARVELLDELDGQVDRLASMMDIRVTPDGQDGIQIYTAGGMALFSGKASRLAFDARGVANATALYDPDPAVSGVGQLKIVDPYGAGVDVTEGGLRSGELAALLRLRDVELVAAQGRLDSVAMGISKALSDRPVAGAPAAVGAQAGFDLDLAGLQSGNVVTLDVLEQPGATARRYSIVRVDSAASLPLPQDATADPGDFVIGIDFSGGLAAAAASLQTALGPTFTVSNPGAQTLRILDDGAAGARDIVSLSAVVTNTALTGQGLELPFFVDAGSGVAARAFSGSFEGGDQRVGYAARIALNPAIAADPSRLVVSSTAPLTPAGDGSRPRRLIERLNDPASFFPAGNGAAAFQGTPGAYLRYMLDEQASVTADALRTDESQTVIVSSLRERFSEVSGVSVDEEMARLVELQNAYSANARVIATVKEMLDALMNL